MFQIGDKIVYPMYGAGVIETIEEKEILGEKQQYFLIKMQIGDLQLMVPVGKISNLGIRLAVDVPTLENTLLIFHDSESAPSLSWNQRYRMNMDKMRTGDIQDGAEVIRDLLHRKKEKTLNTSEARMLHNAWQILISELALVKGCTENQANDVLNKEVNSVEMYL